MSGSHEMASFIVLTFGCQMNRHDSERIRELLGQAGHRPVARVEEAELVVVNTCSVRAKAEQKLRSALGRLGRRGPGGVLCVAGCVAQEQGRRLLQRMPQVDLVVGPDKLAELPGLVDRVRAGERPLVRTGFELDQPRFLAAAEAPARSPTAYVTVMKGCNERCSFCIVPRTRGPERYRPASEIVDEVARLVRAGVREVTLLGQTVNSYRDPAGQLEPEPGGEGSGLPLAGGSQFAALLRAIVGRVPELLRVRYTSPHPRYLGRSLIAAHRDLPQLVRHVHLPVQSGSDRVLKRMVRRHSAAEYVERVAALREAARGVTLSTDIIVGFPGETPADHEATLRLIREVGFVGLFGFKYSPRPGTPALKLGDDVSEADKRERLAQVFAVADQLRERHLAGLVGTMQQVLVEGPAEGGGETGRTERQEIVHFEGARDRVGQVVAVRITEALRHSLRAQLLTDPAPWTHRVRLEPGRPSLHPARPDSRRYLPVV